ncbi:MAG TPA: hypothetical protein VFS30_03035 [Dehalococcoidia bacterium]|nr:hypothetical protein [Dehalococcoidia bacterium]
MALIALVAFVFGVLLNGYIALSVLDDGTSNAAPSSEEAPLIVPAAATAVPTATPTPLPDRTDCDEIRGTDYHSASEREFFLENCINQPEPSPTIDPTQLPALDGGTSTEAIEDTPTPEP